MNEIKIHSTTVLFRKDSFRDKSFNAVYVHIFIPRCGDHKYLLWRGTLSTDLVVHRRFADFVHVHILLFGIDIFNTIKKNVGKTSTLVYIFDIPLID